MTIIDIHEFSTGNKMEIFGAIFTLYTQNEPILLSNFRITHFC